MLRTLTENNLKLIASLPVVLLYPNNIAVSRADSSGYFNIETSDNIS